MVAEATEQPRDEVFCGAHHGHPQAAAGQALHAVDFLNEGFPFVHHRARGGSKLAAGFGEMHAAGNHFIKRQADRVGDFAQLHRGGGLGDMHRTRSGAHAAGVGEREEKAHLTEGDIH